MTEKFIFSHCVVSGCICQLYTDDLCLHNVSLCACCEHMKAFHQFEGILVESNFYSHVNVSTSNINSAANISLASSVNKTPDSSFESTK